MSDVRGPAGSSSSGNLRRRRDIALNILKPSVRLLSEIFYECPILQPRFKHMDYLIQELIDWKEQLSSSETLSKIEHGILQILTLVRRITAYSAKCPEDMVHFFDSAIEILLYIYNSAEYPTICLKREISDALYKLKFARNLLWLVRNRLTDHLITVGLLDLLCSSFVPLVESRFSSKFSLGLRSIRERIHTLVYAIGIDNNSQDLPVQNDKVIDQDIVDFFDVLINELRKLQMSWDSAAVPNSSIIDLKAGMEAIVGELSFYICNLLDILKAYTHSDDIVRGMESITSSTVALVLEMACQLYNPGIEQQGALGTANFWSYYVPRLLEGFYSLKEKVGVLFNCSVSSCSLSSSSSSSSSSHVDYITTFIDNLQELMDYKAASIAPLKRQMETYCQEMVLVMETLASQIANDQTVKPQMGLFIARFKELAYQSSYIIDSFLTGEDSLWHHKLRLFVVTNEVKTASKKMKVSATVSSKHEMRVTKSAHSQLVGLEDATDQIIERLIRGATDMRIISIVGMPGLGKTTVANSVYEDLSINMHFHVQAWCNVSQVYKKETLLIDIVSQVVGETKTVLEEVTADDLAEMLYQNLKGRRYLIVMDDIWDIAAWKDLQKTFPNDNNGSRILFTTQHLDVARRANSQHYNLRLLSDEESYKLLCLKVFDRDICPPDLSIISRRIAINCKGLPLAVVLVAGILTRTERRKQSWELVDASVQSLAGERGAPLDIMRVRDILDLSYKHLPDDLKPCFLYLAAFVGDTSISMSKLIQMWISEEFVQEENLHHESLEEEAKSYLVELIDRSLVTIAKRSSNGGVKACRIHHILRDFCSLKSLHLISEEPMLGGVMRLHRHSFCYSIPNQANNSCVKWKGKISERPVFIQKCYTGKKVLSERVNSQANQHMGSYYDFIFECNSLRVLDLGKVRMESSADTCDIIMVAKLVHLRFLGIRPRKPEIPAEIGNLRNLETLSLTGVIGYLKLPESLWTLSRLRNVLMDHGFFSFLYCNCSTAFLHNFSQLYDLRSVSTLSLNHGDYVESCFLRRLPCLQKLACRFVYSWDNAKCFCVFPVLDFLNQLESLKVFFSGVVRYPCIFNFPSNLKKLSLSNSRLPWVATAVIMEQLQNLEVLKLLNKAFEGQQWDIEDGRILFPKLKFLKLDSLDIQVWNAEYESFPCLEQLVVLSCSQLAEIPSCFGEISTLQSIEMKWCRSSAMGSVNQILQVQRDLSNDDLKVTLIGLA